MTDSTQHPFTGRYVLCRCYSAGVHCGELVSLSGEQAILKNSRRLWFWRAHRQRAAREAENAIRRAQRSVERDGNVIRPDSFKGPRKPH